MTTHAPDKAAREAFPLLARIDAYFAGSYNRVPHHEAEFLLRKCRDVVAAHDAAMAAEQHPWPFVNSPQEVADKMSDTCRLFEGNMLAALRHVFIEKQEPVTARIALQAAQQREANAIMASNELAMSAERATAGLIAELQAAQQREAELRVALEVAKAALDNCYFEITGAIFEQDKAALKAVNAALATQPTSKGETT